MNRAIIQEILHRMHSLAEAKKPPTKKPIVPRTSSKTRSTQTLKNYQSDINHLADRIKEMQNAHADMLKRHKHANERHAAGDHEWVIRNHYMQNKPF